jgi:hypothetical protein
MDYRAPYSRIATFLSSLHTDDKNATKIEPIYRPTFKFKAFTSTVQCTHIITLSEKQETY